MRWIASKNNPPIYVWDGHKWYNESDKLIYSVDIVKGAWVNENADPFFFTKKTRIGFISTKNPESFEKAEIDAQKA